MGGFGPTAGVVRDGNVTAAGDAAFWPDASSIAAHWAGFKVSNGSPVAKYAWGIGTSPFGFQEQVLTEVAAGATAATRSSLYLVEGARYYVTVQATDCGCCSCLGRAGLMCGTTGACWQARRWAAVY